MRQKRMKNMNFKMLWRESGEILSQNANRLKLIEATMICVTPLLLYQTLIAAYQGIILAAFDPVSEPLRAFFWEIGFWSVLSVFTLLFSLPLSTGLLGMAEDMEDGKESVLSDVFRAFTSARSYWRSLRISWALFWRFALVILTESVTYTLFDIFVPSLGGKLLCVGVMILEAFLWLWLACFGFFKTYYLAKDLKAPVKRARMQSYTCSFSVFYWLHFLPWMLLSLVSFCILLLADLLPRMLLAYFRLCRKLSEKIQSEEPENE